LIKMVESLESKLFMLDRHPRKKHSVRERKERIEEAWKYINNVEGKASYQTSLVLKIAGATILGAGGIASNPITFGIGGGLLAAGFIYKGLNYARIALKNHENYKKEQNEDAKSYFKQHRNYAIGKSLTNVGLSTIVGFVGSYALIGEVGIVERSFSNLYTGIEYTMSTVGSTLTGIAGALVGASTIVATRFRGKSAKLANDSVKKYISNNKKTRITVTKRVEF